jgi:DNA-binding NtrC family response regulator
VIPGNQSRLPIPRRYYNLVRALYLLPGMASILVIAETDLAANAIEQTLTQRGHLITTATDFTHIEASGTGLIFDLVVLGPDIRSKVKEAILLQVREYCPTVPVLDVCSPGACAAAADFSLRSDSLEALAAAATSMLQSHRKKAG